MKGRISAGIATTNRRSLRLAGMGVRSGRSPPAADEDEEREAGGGDAGREQAAGEQRRDGHAGDGADDDQHQAGRDGFRHGGRGGELGRELAARHAAAAHFGQQHRGDGGLVGGLGAGDAGDEVHGGDQHIGEAAALVADEGGEEFDHGAGDAGHFEQQAEDDEHRHREQLDGRHALVHLADDDGERDGAGEVDVGEGGDGEAEGDGHAEEDAGAGDADEEDDQGAVADIVEPVLQKIQRGEDGGGDEHDAQQLDPADAAEHLTERGVEQEREGGHLAVDFDGAGDLQDGGEDRALLGRRRTGRG